MNRTVIAPAVLLLSSILAIGTIFAVHKIEAPGGPLAQPWASAWFSPNGDNYADTALIRFTAKRHERITIAVIDSHGKTIKHLVENQTIKGPTQIEWDGSTDAGKDAPEGTYTVQITRAGDERSYAPVRPITLDLTPPRGRLDRATWEDGKLRGLALLEPNTRLAIFDGQHHELPQMRSFYPLEGARSAQPEGPKAPGTLPVRFTIPIDKDKHDLSVLSFYAIDKAENRTNLQNVGDAPTIKVLLDD